MVELLRRPSAAPTAARATAPAVQDSQVRSPTSHSTSSPLLPPGFDSPAAVYGDGLRFGSFPDPFSPVRRPLSSSPSMVPETPPSQLQPAATCALAPAAGISTDRIAGQLQPAAMRAPIPAAGIFIDWTAGQLLPAASFVDWSALPGQAAPASKLLASDAVPQLASSGDDWHLVRPRHWWRQQPSFKQAQQRSRGAPRRPNLPAFITREKRGAHSVHRSRECFRCFSVGHIARFCRNPIRCRYCRYQGHIERQCRRRRRDLANASRHRQQAPPPPPPRQHSSPSTPPESQLPPPPPLPRPPHPPPEMADAFLCQVVPCDRQDGDRRSRDGEWRWRRVGLKSSRGRSRSVDAGRRGDDDRQQRHGADRRDDRRDKHRVVLPVLRNKLFSLSIG